MLCTNGDIDKELCVVVMYCSCVTFIKRCILFLWRCALSPTPRNKHDTVTSAYQLPSVAYYLDMLIHCFYLLRLVFYFTCYIVSIGIFCCYQNSYKYYLSVKNILNHSIYEYKNCAKQYKKKHMEQKAVNINNVPYPLRIYSGE